MFNRNSQKKQQIEQDIAKRTKASQFLLSPLTIVRSYPGSFFMFGAAKHASFNFLNSVSPSDIIHEEKNPSDLNPSTLELITNQESKELQMS
jgi:hypothetical protein